MTTATTSTERQAAALRDCAITRRTNALIDELVRKDADRARALLDAAKVAS